jgi:hypothetical protein
MQKRLAARNCDHRRATFLDCLEALLRRKLRLQDVGRILNLPASRTREIAAHQRLEHEDERIAPTPHQLLFQDVGGDGPGLRNWDCHVANTPRSPVTRPATRNGYSIQGRAPDLGVRSWAKDSSVASVADFGRNHRTTCAARSAVTYRGRPASLVKPQHPRTRALTMNGCFRRS